MDITQLILDDHHEQRRLFALLDQIDPGEVAALHAIWSQLGDFLEVHAEAEERHFYPALLEHGEGADGKTNANAETLDAIKDHNEIRDAIAKVATHTPGRDYWPQAGAPARQPHRHHPADQVRHRAQDRVERQVIPFRHDVRRSLHRVGRAVVGGLYQVVRHQEPEGSIHDQYHAQADEILAG